MKYLIKEKEFWIGVLSFILLTLGGYIAFVAGYALGAR